MNSLDSSLDMENFLDPVQNKLYKINSGAENQ